jgi:type II secretion system protein G
MSRLLYHSCYVVFCCLLAILAAWTVFAMVPAQAAPRLDASFGRDGRVAVELGVNNSANAIALQPDGKIVVAGSVNPGEARNFSLLRFNQDGSLDTSFNGEGALITSVSLGDDEALALGILADGRIVAGGYSFNGKNRDFALVCYFADGRLDKGFGRNGVVLTPVSGGDDEISALVISADNKIVVAGNVSGTAGTVAVAARYLADGELDSSFGERGVSLIGVGEVSRAEGIVLRDEGGVVLSGTFRTGNRTSLMLVGLDSHGLLDNSFGQNGVAVPAGTLPLSEGYRLAVDSEGLLYVAGAVGAPGKRDSALFRFFSNGSPDPDFGRTGVVINPVSPADDVLYDVAVNPRGVVASGFTTEAGQRRFLLASYTPVNGSLDAAGMRLPVVQLVEGKKYPVLSNEVKRRPKMRQAQQVRLQRTDALVMPLPSQRRNAHAAAGGFSSDNRIGSSSDHSHGKGQDHNQNTPTHPWQRFTQTLVNFFFPAAMAAERILSPDNSAAALPEEAAKVRVFSFGQGEGVSYAATMDGAGNVLVVGTVARGQGSSMAVARFDAASLYTTDAFVNQLGFSTAAIRTGLPNGITRSTATCGGEILPVLGAPVRQRGLVFSTKANPVLLWRSPPAEAGEEDFFVAAGRFTPHSAGLTQRVPDEPARSGHGKLSPLSLGDASSGSVGNRAVANATGIFGAEMPAAGRNPVLRGATANGAGHGSFSTTLNALRPGTVYYVRAYAITQDGQVFYGTQHAFTTAEACFIATAAFGSLTHPAVAILRQFRDSMLSTNTLGQSFIDTYYRFSPPLAQVIAGHAPLRWVVYLALLPLVAFSWLALHCGLLLALALALSMPVMMYLTCCMRRRAGTLLGSPSLRRQPLRRLRRQQGFTLIELMVVMVILGILAALVVPRIMDRPEEARRTKAEVQIRAMEQALQLYRLDNGQYPTTEQGLQALVALPTLGPPARKWRQGGYLERGRVPKDPWDGNYVYLCPGLHGDFDLMSYGADNQVGGEGRDADVNNWELE